MRGVNARGEAREYTIQDIQDILERAPAFLAVDTETDGQPWYRAELGVISMAWGADPDDCFATREVHPPEVGGPAIETLNLLADRGCTFIFHNASFDMHMLERYGARIPWSQVTDTMILSRLRDNLGEHGLKKLGENLLGYPPDLQDEVKVYLKGTKNKNFLTVPDHTLLPYAAEDARLTFELYEHFAHHFNAADYTGLFHKEMKVREILYESEKKGIEIAPGYAAVTRDVVQDEAELILRKLRELRGRDTFNPGSPAQVSGWLFSDLAHPVLGRTKVGAPSTEDAYLVLTHSAPGQLIRAWRGRQKTAQYLQEYLDYADPNNRIHPNINTLLARTGRMSSDSPNLQQVPVRNDRFGVRSVFQAGHGFFVGADFDKQELRISAALANDPQLLSALRDGRDVYREIASTILARPAESITPLQRHAAKQFVLGTTYGAGARKLSIQLSADLGFPVTESDARDWRTRLRGGYGTLMRAMSEASNNAERTGKVINPWGRVMHVDPQRPYTAWNYLVQSSAGDVTKDAVVLADEVAKCYNGHIVMPVHDEIWFWFPDEPSRATLLKIEAAMYTEKLERIPLTASAKVGKTVKDLK